jgi:BirA family biotin operon repressor/biotin-[acetyl-CoA-carboxylase] ligase
LSLSSYAAASNWRIEAFDELASTSDYCITRAKAGEPEGLAILAARQTAARGSRGRAWTAPEGNLNLSILLRPSIPAANSGIFPLTAGLAAAEAVNAFLPPGVAITLKWPNDLILAGHKLGGILIDAAPNGAKLDWLVIGIGVNLRNAWPCTAAAPPPLKPARPCWRA